METYKLALNEFQIEDLNNLYAFIIDHPSADSTVLESAETLRHILELCGDEPVFCTAMNKPIKLINFEWVRCKKEQCNTCRFAIFDTDE